MTQERPAEPYEYAEIHMGLPVRIRMYAADRSAAEAAARAAFARIAELDRMMSDYRPDSELRRLSSRGQQWTAVSAELFEVLERAVTIARMTDGAFDPTVGPLVALWREAQATRRLPDPQAISRARSIVGWRLIALDRARRAVRLVRPGMQLDFGAIAKGYILQQSLSVLRDMRVPSALIQSGGDIVVGAAPPGRDGWDIQVDRANVRLSSRAARLTNAALATSGPTEQFADIDGRRYSHVIDPRTGMALTNRVIAHVIAPDGATADALSTALTVLARDRRAAVLARFGDVLASVVVE
ncbi:MAG TPA: FAD:protein FMN transferase [Vicinamibacterales bacterium]|nr:FAD:protein FMN transferase [Vicinamibacterales bacterium]